MGMIPSNLPKGPTCTHREDDCHRTVYRDGLCRAHHRLWKQCGGGEATYPGDRRRYVIVPHDEDRTEWDVVDLAVGQVAFTSPFFDEAADRMSELRLGEQLGEAA